jgi:spore coat polysaccharide biosynthesis protein SpsF (cytidylyltransferase family)
MRTRVVIQSRLNSSRLPGKAMLDVGGMPLVELVARRAARSGHEVVVATSVERYDDRIAAHLTARGVEVVRGSLDDVLGRFVTATRSLDPGDRVVRLTGDNPVADADLVDELLAAMDASGHRYGRVDIDRVPEGLGAEAFTVDDLRRADREAVDGYDREHVTPWLRRTLGELLFVPSRSPGDVLAHRATVDTLGDYVRVCDLFERVDDPVGVAWADLMDALAARVDAAGPRTPHVSTAVGVVSRVVPSSRRFTERPAGTGPAVWAEGLRSLVGDAVDLGVTHLDTGPGDVELLRVSTDPALTRRAAVVARVAPAGDTALALEAAVERVLAGLGRRGPVVLVVDRMPSGPAWRRARAYVDEGVATALGVVAHDAAALAAAARTPEVAWVEVRLPGPDADTTGSLEALRDRGAALAQPWRRGDAVRSWATCLLVQDPSGDAVRAAVAAVTAAATP